MEQDLSYILNQLGEEREHWMGAVSPPLFQTSNFAFPDVAGLRESLQKEQSIPVYTRGQNPTVAILREKMAALEGTEDALIFASGSAAIAAGVMANVKAGDHVLSVAKPYSWTQKLLENILAGYGVSYSYIRGTRLEEFEEAIRPTTRLIYLESPNSFTFDLQDLRAVADLARQKDIVTMIDNSYSGPLYQNPVEYGIDVVAHSASKYISGHSDTVAGVLCGSKSMMEKVFYGPYMTLGGIIAPFNAWLLLRGIRTLEIRLDRSSSSTEWLLSKLENHPKIERIYYPHYPGHPQYAMAKKQMKRAGGLFTLALKAERMEEIEVFCNRIRRFLIAVSWGGHESLLFPACAAYSGGGYQPEDLNWKLVRFYVGLENPADLLEDILQALDE
jgi:cystathionine beta-lyase/cystathionine gamma-synthase